MARQRIQLRSIGVCDTAYSMKINAYKILFGRAQKKISHGRCRHRWEDNINPSAPKDLNHFK
jgi:hypothetical protein